MSTYIWYHLQVVAPFGSNGNHYQLLRKLQGWLQLVLRMQLQLMLQLQLVLKLQLQLQLRVLWGNPNFSNFKFWNSDPKNRCVELRRVCWCTQNFENPTFTPSNLIYGFLDWCFWFSGTSVLLVLWFSSFLVLCETRVSLPGRSSHWKGALMMQNWSLGEGATI